MSMGEHFYDHSGMSPSTPAAQHKGSSRHHATAPSSTNTTRPAIKIIHIVAPEIIKTDVASFRDLVQRLTGRQQQKPAADYDESKPVTVSMAPTPASPVEEKPQKRRLLPAPALAEDFLVQEENMRRKKIKCEVVKVEEGEFGFGGGGELDFGDLWMDLNPEGFLSFLEEDVFQGDLLQPPLGSSRRDLIGEMCASFLA